MDTDDSGNSEGRSLDAHTLASLLTLPVFGAAVLLVLAGMIFFVPRFEEIFRQLNIDLPVPTRLMLLASRMCVRGWFAVLPAAALAVAAPMLLARRRAWAFYTAGTLLALVLAFGGFASIYLPVVKIQQMLTKKH